MPSVDVAHPTYPVAIGMTSSENPAGRPLYHMVHSFLLVPGGSTTHEPSVALSNPLRDGLRTGLTALDTSEITGGASRSTDSSIGPSVVSVE